MNLKTMKKAGAGIVSILMALSLSACSIDYSALRSYAESKKAENPSMTEETQDQFQKELSAFEITAFQRKLAPDNEAGYPVLDAGRGNPNWINGKVRHACDVRRNGQEIRLIRIQCGQL